MANGFLDNRATMAKLLWCVVLAACTSDATPVGEANSLGVTSLEVEHGDSFELRGLDRTGDVIARVRLRVGEIADLPHYVPGGAYGSEIVLSLAGHEDQRLITREVHRFALANIPDPAIAEFVALDEVSATLAREANIFIAPKTDETPYWGYVDICPQAYLNTTPVAQMCCYTYRQGYAAYTDFYSAATNAIVLRYQGHDGGCKAEDGSSCSGAGCYWGPAGFSRPMLWVGSGTPRIYTDYSNGFAVCTGNWFATDPGSEWPDATGWNPPNQGCPGGGVGGAGEWDY